MSVSVALLTAIYDRLKADATLETLLEAARGTTLSAPLPIYLLQAPPNERLPVITFNEVVRAAFDTSDSIGGEHTIDVHCYSGAASPKEAYDILARVEALLTDPSMTVTGYSLVHCRLASLRCDVDPDGSYHGVATFRVLTSQ
jgi:hypothetical protein